MHVDCRSSFYNENHLILVVSTANIDAIIFMESHPALQIPRQLLGRTALMQSLSYTQNFTIIYVLTFFELEDNFI